MSGMQITRDDWLAAIGATQEPTFSADDPSVLTISEFATLLQRSRTTAENKMNALVKAGKAQRVQKWIRRAGGELYPAPAYRLIQEAHDEPHDARRGRPRPSRRRGRHGSQPGTRR